MTRWSIHLVRRSWSTLDRQYTLWRLFVVPPSRLQSATAKVQSAYPHISRWRPSPTYAKWCFRVFLTTEGGKTVQRNWFSWRTMIAHLIAHSAVAECGRVHSLPSTEPRLVLLINYYYRLLVMCVAGKRQVAIVPDALFPETALCQL
ncbi:unnamed protein product, partial [Iphiclides podalirius]